MSHMRERSGEPMLQPLHAYLPRTYVTQQVQAAMATTCGTVAAAAPSRRCPWALWQHANDETDATNDAGAMSSVSSVDATSGFNPLGPRVGTWVTVGAGETDGALVVGTADGAGVAVGAGVAKQHATQSASPALGRPSVEQCLAFL